MKKQLSIFDGTDETKEALAISLIKSFEGVSRERVRREVKRESTFALQNYKLL